MQKYRIAKTESSSWCSQRAHSKRNNTTNQKEWKKEKKSSTEEKRANKEVTTKTKDVEYNNNE